MPAEDYSHLQMLRIRGLFHGNQIFICFDPNQKKGEVGTVSPPVIVFVRRSKAVPLLWILFVFLFHFYLCCAIILSLAALSHAEKRLTSWLSCVLWFLSLSQLIFLIVSIPDFLPSSLLLL